MTSPSASLGGTAMRARAHSRNRQFSLAIRRFGVALCVGAPRTLRCGPWERALTRSLDRLNERQREAVRPLLATDEVVEDVLGNAVFTSRQFVVCTTSLSGGFRDPFAVSAVGFRYADIVAVVPA